MTTEPVTIYKPADYDDPALLAEAARLGCDPTDVVLVEDETWDGDDYVRPDTMRAVRLYRSSDGDLFVEGDEHRVPEVGEAFWLNRVHFCGTREHDSSETILRPARWAGEQHD